MHRAQNEPTFRLSMSGEDWELIDSALTAYAHNATYRDLRDKLDMQVALVRAMDGATRDANAGGKRQDPATRGRTVTRPR